MTHSLYIENLPSHEGRAELEQLLKPFGSVRHLTLATDPDMIRRHAGLAVVEMDTAVQATAAIRGLEGMEYRGCTLRARPALVRDADRLGSICRWALSTHEHPGSTAHCISDALPTGGAKPTSRDRRNSRRRQQR